MFQLNERNMHSLWSIFEDIVSRSNAILANRMAYDEISPSIIQKSGSLQDYTRYRSLELVAQEIKDNEVQGCLAEAGVCKGAFAMLINYLFPERELYLFDTFEGFLKEQVDNDFQQGLISEWFTQEGVFSDTSVELVLNNMPHKEKVIPVKGLFEQTSRTVDKQFAFVSLDMDLYAPMLAGLEYFYPRLSCGGYIFMHDYNHAKIQGVKLAVREYEKKHNIQLHKVPLCDEGGTLVIAK